MADANTTNGFTALGNLDLTMNRIQALATAIENMVPAESSAAYLAAMIQDIASDIADRRAIEAALTAVKA